MFTRKINFPEPMPHENKFPDRAHAENKLSVQTKFDSPPPPPPQNQIVIPLHCVLGTKVPKYKPINCLLRIARCASRHLQLALFTVFDVITLFREVSIWHLPRMRLANRGHLLLRTPGPVPFGTFISSDVETILSWTCHVYGPSEFEQPSVLLLCFFGLRGKNIA